MKRVALAVFVAVFGAMLLLFARSSPRGPDEEPVGYWVGLAVLSLPFGVAAAILWRAWWRSTGVRLLDLDGPARLLAVAVGTLPVERRDWGTAMTAELAEVPDRRARWRFAAGCARTALFPPHGRWRPVLSVALLTAGMALASHLALARALPAMRLFAVAFVVLVGVLAIATAARTARVRRPAPGWPLATAGLAGVAACVAITAYTLATRASDALAPSAAVVLAVVLAGSLWLTLAAPRSLTTSRLAARLGIGAALVFTAGMVVDLHVYERGGEGVLPYLLVGSLGCGFVVSLVASATDRSFAAGAQAVVWTTVVACLLTFAALTVEALSWHQTSQTSLLDGDLTKDLLQESIVFVLIVLPLCTLPFGVIGAALGSIGTGRQRADVPTVAEPS